MKTLIIRPIMRINMYIGCCVLFGDAEIGGGVYVWVVCICIYTYTHVYAYKSVCGRRRTRLHVRAFVRKPSRLEIRGFNVPLPAAAPYAICNQSL